MGENIIYAYTVHIAYGSHTYTHTHMTPSPHGRTLANHQKRIQKTVIWTQKTVATEYDQEAAKEMRRKSGEPRRTALDDSPTQGPGRAPRLGVQSLGFPGNKPPNYSYKNTIY